MSWACWLMRPELVWKRLVEKAAHLLLPLLAVLFQMTHGFVRIHEDKAGAPAVFARQLGELAEQIRMGLQRKTVDGDHLQERLPHPRDDAPVEFLAEEPVQVDRVARQIDRLALAAHATPQMGEKIVFGFRRIVLVLDGPTRQTFELETEREPGFERVDLVLELHDQIVGTHPVGGSRIVVVEHQFHELALRQHGREPRGRDVKGLQVRLAGPENIARRSSSMARVTLSGKWESSRWL